MCDWKLTITSQQDSEVSSSEYGNELLSSIKHGKFIGCLLCSMKFVGKFENHRLRLYKISWHQKTSGLGHKVACP